MKTLKIIIKVNMGLLCIGCVAMVFGLFYLIGKPVSPILIVSLLIAIAFAILQFLMTLGFLHVVDNAIWVSENKSLLNQILKPNQQTEEIHASATAAPNAVIIEQPAAELPPILESVQIAPKEYGKYKNAEPLCQCHDCAYFNDDIPSRCFVYTDARPVQYLSDSEICPDKQI